MGLALSLLQGGILLGYMVFSVVKVRVVVEVFVCRIPALLLCLSEMCTADYMLYSA